MVIDLKDIKRIRRTLGMTQGELASRAGVSQSLVAKVESGLLDPAYSKAQKILNTLDEASRGKEAVAKEVMQKKILSVSVKDKLSKAVRLMKDHQISQTPVLDARKAVGLISESILLEAMMSGNKSTVGEVMSEVPPIVAPETPLHVVTELLKYYQLVLVETKGKVAGLITRADVLSYV